MAGAEADAAGFSDLSDSELLQAEEPREAEEPRSARGPDGAGKRKRAQRPLDRCALRYLCVTGLAGQSWCEQQMVFGMEQPRPLAPETAALLDTGKSIHLARELEVHDLVKIPTTSREDCWAIKILNLLSVIPVLQAGGHVRELPVFGVIEGVFVSGIIDELCYNTKGELELNELKTRSRPFMPGKAQRKKDHFQSSHQAQRFEEIPPHSDTARGASS
ncbi:PREDICTED: exonuclease V isoform X2 [Crocodylus porosus]|uniref:exonuclease V isoform X2 n=1 Tax=Crocodylus porosus TaxID=8502 RepID=UPI00093D01B3|nr:PREDICTED: exonuclease V isoform X2 [Crocodylus porosus]